MGRQTRSILTGIALLSVWISIAVVPAVAQAPPRRMEPILPTAVVQGMTETKLSVTGAAPGDQCGYAVSASGNVMVVGAFGDSTRGSYAGAVFVFRFNGTAWVEEQKLLASDGQAGDFFGFSVSISGDRLIVGAFGDDSERGAAYLFEFDGTSWDEVQKLTASDSVVFHDFGISVAISGTRAVVGAFGDPVNGTFAGAAYVFDRSGAAWSESAKLNHAAAAAGDNFGISVSVQGTRVVVGADGVDGAGSSRGAAYVFERVGANWAERATLTPSDPADFDFFGQSVVVIGDRVLVGAPLDDDLGNESGSAYLFEFDGSSWGEIDKLNASDGAAGDRFGTSVAGEPNVFLVGSFAEAEMGQEAGAAYLFDLQGGVWTERTKLTATDGAEFDAYGISVAQSSGRSLIGAAGDEDATGAAYVLQLEDSQHRFLLLAETLIEVDRWGSTRGNVHSNGDVDFQRGDPSTLYGNITAVDDVDIDRDHTIAGDVTAGGSVSVHNQSSVSGTITENAAVVAVPLPSFNYFAGGPPVNVGNSDFLALAPGSYSTVDVGARGILYLYHDGNGGDYFFTDLDVRDRALIWVNSSSGPVNVNVVTDVRFHNRSWVWTTPFSDLAVLRTTFRSLRGDMDFDDSAYIRGSLIAPDGRVRFRRRGTLRGTICADTIEIDEETRIQAPSTSTPGPLLPIFRVGEVTPPGEEPELVD